MPKHLKGKLTQFNGASATLEYIEGSTTIIETFLLHATAQKEAQTFDVKCGMWADIIPHPTIPKTALHITPLAGDPTLQPITAATKILKADKAEIIDAEAHANIVSAPMERLAELLEASRNTPVLLANSQQWRRLTWYGCVVQGEMHLMARFEPAVPGVDADKGERDK